MGSKHHRWAERSWKSRLKIILATSFVMALLTLLILNLAQPEKQIEHHIDHRYGVNDPQFARAMGSLVGPGLLAGNRITALLNGDEIFPAMLSAVREAQKSITFETYIFWSGTVGRQFTEALAERARAGVRVHVLLDWVGSGRMDKELLEMLEQSGAQVERYHPLHWYSLGRLNNRTHRKLLVIDGRVGFTGGAGIADEWQGNAQDADHWRDSHFRLEGPAVAQMQSAFMDNWIKARSKVLHGDDYFPALAPVGDAYAHVTRSSYSDGSESVRLLYLLSIASAERNIRLANAYFVPDQLAIDTLVAAKKRGVDVEIIVPGQNTDVPLTRGASRARWGDLLEAGIEIFEYQPTMYHCKVMVVDDLWVSVGSTNFDNRSFRLNDEANLNVFDRAFALDQARAFEADKKLSKRITLEAWRTRPFKEKVQEWLASLLGSQL